MPDSSDPALVRLLAPFVVEELERYPHTVYAASLNHRIRYVNRAWYRFAADNAGEPAISQRWSVGADLMAAVPKPLRAYYEHLYRQSILIEPYPSKPLTVTYDCSTPTWLRLFVMTLYPLRSRQGVLMINTPVVVQPHDPQRRPPHDPIEQRYRDSNGFIHQCAHCRRVQTLRSGEWDWVPHWVIDFPVNTSHTLCEFCYRYYYDRRSAEELIARG